MRHCEDSIETLPYFHSSDVTASLLSLTVIWIIPNSFANIIVWLEIKAAIDENTLPLKEEFHSNYIYQIPLSTQNTQNQ